MCPTTALTHPIPTTTPVMISVLTRTATLLKTSAKNCSPDATSGDAGAVPGGCDLDPS